jgi:hypothetical protein
MYDIICLGFLSFFRSQRISRWKFLLFCDSRVSCESHYGEIHAIHFKISFCFYLLSFISRCEEVILGPHLDQSVLYQLMKESPKKHVLGKSNNQNIKSGVELIRITSCRVTRISL